MKKIKSKQPSVDKSVKLLNEKIKAKKKEFSAAQARDKKVSLELRKIHGELADLEREKAIAPFKAIEIQKGDIIVKNKDDYGWHSDIAKYYIILESEKGISTSAITVHRSDERLSIYGEKPSYYKDSATLLWRIGFTKGDKVLPFEKGREDFIKLLRSLESDSSLTDSLGFILSVLDPKDLENTPAVTESEVEKNDEEKGEN